MKRAKIEICINCGDYDCETCGDLFLVYFYADNHCGNENCPVCCYLIGHDCETTTSGSTCYFCVNWPSDLHCLGGYKYTAQNHPCARKDRHECGGFDFCSYCKDCQCFEGSKCLKELEAK